jgi:integration host factor subunit alpha
VEKSIRKPSGGKDYMTKADIVEKICAVNGFSKKDSAKIVEQVFVILKDTLKNGDKIKISGFGSFVVKEKADRRGRNPQTGEELIIESRKVLTFKPSMVLRDALNK